MKSNCLKIVVSVLIAGLIANTSLAQSKLVLNHPGLPGSLYDISARHFANLVNSMSGGEIQVIVLENHKYGSEIEIIKAGQLILSGSYLSKVAPEFEIFNLPYLIKNREHMQKIDNKIVKPYFARVAQSQGITILGVWEYGFLQIVNNIRPINNSYDFKGMRLATFKNEWHIRTFEYLGAYPIPISMSEVYSASQRRVVEGMEIPLSMIEKSRLYETQKYLSITNHIYTPAFLLIDVRKLRGMSPTHQQLLMHAAEETQRYTYMIAKAMDDETIQKLNNRGMRINYVNSKDISYRVKRIYDEFARNFENGSGLIYKILSME